MPEQPLTLKKPLDSLRLAAIQAVADASAAVTVDFMVVGATARDILLEHVHGLPPSRATRDVDFAIMVETWDAFEQIKQHLLTRGLTADGPHKLRGTLGDHDFGGPVLEIDLLPFGTGVQEPGRSTLRWPPDMVVLFNVAGYSDALACARWVELAPALTVKVVSLPGFAALKLLAWKDRQKANDGKDGSDLIALLRRYADAGIQDRIYEGEGAGYLESVDYRPESTAAWLLGRDVRRLSSPDTLRLLLNILDDPKAERRLIDAGLRSLPGVVDEGAETSIRDLVICFNEGLRLDAP